MTIFASARFTMKWWLVAYALCNALLYSMLLPLWEGFDEPFHFGYVQSLANGQGFPDARTSKLSREVEASLLLAPASLSVQRNLPRVTTYPEFFAWPESRRAEIHRELARIDPGLRWQLSPAANYEAQHAPLAYAILALPERLLARTPLPRRVLVLRMLAAFAGSLLLLSGASRVCASLGMSERHENVVIFCALSTQMTWAILAHVDNDWLAVPLSVWLLAAAIAYNEQPDLRRVTTASLILSLGLLTKAWFLAFVPLVAGICIVRRGWKELGIAALIVVGIAGPWYLRNVKLYGTLSGMQETRERLEPQDALSAVPLRKVPTAVLAWSRSALFTANNSFRAFSIRTLNTLIAVWLAALVLRVISARHRAEWVVVFYCALFLMALGWDTAINYVHSHGISVSPAPWYTQVLLIPGLVLALLGTSRWKKSGGIVAAAMVVLFGYVLVCTYLVKLIPLYSGFGERTSLASVTRLYATHLSTVVAGLNDLCLAPASVILTLSMVVTAIAVGLQFVLMRQVLFRRSEKRI